MPIKSPAQDRLMRAAAHTKGGFGGVPQSVGRDFVDAGKAYEKGGLVHDRPQDRVPDSLRAPELGFDPQGKGYNYQRARERGYGPKPVEHDDVPHWPSRDDQTGTLLKGRRHPTFDVGVEHDRQQGYGLQMQDGRYETQKFEHGGAVQGNDKPLKFGSDTCITCKDKFS